MSERTQKLAIVVTAEDLASGKLGLVRKELAAMGPAGKIGAVGLGLGMGAAQKSEQAFKHLGERITSLAGPIGLIGLTGAAFSVAGALEQGIEKASKMAFAVEKLTGVTGLGTHEASQLVAVFEKFEIDTEGVIKIAGFAEKTLGRLAITNGIAVKSTALLALEQQKLTIQLAGGKTKAIDLEIAHQKEIDTLNTLKDGTSKLDAMDHQYGLTLVDSKGKVVDFGTELKQIADYYVSGASASDKAYVAATLLGKGYTALIPVLQLGSKGIEEMAAEADKLGLTLRTNEDVANVQKFIDAQRKAKEAIGGLEMQLGLLVMPDITGVLRTSSAWLATHREDIQRFFLEGLHGAESLAAFVTGTVVPTVQTLGSAAKGFWDGIPEPLREMLVKGFVADRTVKFLFGFSPIAFAEGALTKGLGGVFGGTLGGFFQRGAPGNPMFVKDVGGVGGAAGVAGATGVWAGVGKIIGGAFAIIAVAEIADALHSAISPGGGLEGRTNSGTLLPGDQLAWPFGPKNTPHIDLGPFKDVLGGDSTFTAGPSDPMSPAAGADRQPRGPENPGDAMIAAAKSWGVVADDLHRSFNLNFHNLKYASNTADVAAAAKAVLANIESGVGDVKTTKGVLATLKDQLRNTHDPQTEAVLRDAIAKVEARLVGREWIEKQIRVAEKIANSTESAKQKTAELKAIQLDLLRHGDTAAAAQIRVLLDIVTGINAVSTAIGGIGSTTRTKDDRYHAPAGSVSGGGGGGSGRGRAPVPRAEGGDVYPGTLYRIGERGEELFRPSVAGTVIPNHGLMSAGMARAVMVSIQLAVNITPKVNVSLRDLANTTAAQLRVGKLTAG